MRELAPLLAVALAALPASAGEGGIEPLNPLTIARALAEARPGPPEPYLFRTARVWVDFDTPLLRLQRKVADAKAQGRPIDDSLASADVTEPVVRATVGPEPSGNSPPEVRQILLEQADGTRVAPRSVVKTVEKLKGRKGQLTLKGLAAVFPLEALRPGARFRAILSDKREETVALPPGWFDQPR